MGDSSEAEPAGREVADRGLTVGEIKTGEGWGAKMWKGEQKKKQGGKAASSHAWKDNKQKRQGNLSDTWQTHGSFKGSKKHSTTIQKSGVSIAKLEVFPFQTFF